MPAAAHTEKDGSFTNTQRLLQWHHKAVEPRGDARSELWFYYHLGKRIKAKLAEREEPNAALLRALTWEYPEKGALQRTRRARRIARNQRLGCGGQGAAGIHGAQSRRVDRVRLLDLLRMLQRRDRTRPQTASRATNRVGSRREWGWAWPANRRLLYNRASADPERQALERTQAIRLVGRRESASGRATTRRTSRKQSVPTTRRRTARLREAALAGRHPFIMQDDGLGWIFTPNGVVDGPLPTYYEPQESPVRNLLYGQQANPCRQQFPRRFNEYNPVAERRARRSLSVRSLHLSPHRTSYRRRDVAHRGAALGASAGVLLRSDAGACGAARPAARAMGDDFDAYAAVVEARVMITRSARRVLRVNGRVDSFRRLSVPLGE